VNTEKVSPDLTAKIIRGYVRHHRLGPDQLPDLIVSIHQALGQLGQQVQPAEVLTPAVSIRQSVRHDYVVCLDCSYRGKTLRRHLGVRHGLNGDEYRRRWGLRSDHPLTAPAYSERRSTLAKELGLGRKSVTAVAPAPAEPAAAKIEAQVERSPEPRRTRRSRSKSVDTVSEAVKSTSAKRRRSRARAASVAEQTNLPTDQQSEA
jgi:predicted transcriptional regulator